MLPGYAGNMRIGGSDPFLFGTTFDANTVGSFPSDWTSRYTTNGTVAVQSVASPLGGKVLRHTRANSNRCGFSWDTPGGAITDAEILLLVRQTSGWASGSDNLLLSYFRGSGASATATGVRLGAKAVSGNNRIIGSGVAYKNGATSGGLGADVECINPYVLNNWLWIRSSVVGTLNSLKIWAYGAAEPSSPQSTLVDSYVTTSGWVGFQSVAGPTVEIAGMFVHTKGDRIPLPI